MTFQHETIVNMLISMELDAGIYKTNIIGDLCCNRWI